MNRSKPKPLSIYPSLFVFAVAMGFLEAIVVVYVRELYYPEGFACPLKPMPEWLIGTEMIRELCTLFMLGAVARITGKLFTGRLASFLFLFGVWDIFYYVALWLFLGWPESLLTWDILFLIPVAWVGPVLAPVLCSVLMIFIAFLLEWKLLKISSFRLGTKEIILFLSGAFLIFIAFIYDFSVLVIKGNYLTQFFSLADNPDFLNDLNLYIPNRFQWELFLTGLALIGTAILILWGKTEKTEKR